MSYALPKRDRIQSVLGPHASDFEEAAADADDPADADVYTALAALAHGNDIPARVARRIVHRAEVA